MSWVGVAYVLCFVVTKVFRAVLNSLGYFRLTQFSVMLSINWFVGASCETGYLELLLHETNCMAQFFIE